MSHPAITEAAAGDRPIPLTAPADGVPDVVQTPEDLQRAADALGSGHGPVAVDAERASGFRYTGRAYLVQLRRAGAGTFLIDPTRLDGLAPVADALGDTEWVLHAASQDLPCLRAEGLSPGGNLFDTELGGRLAGLHRVALGTMTEQLLGYTLAKEHAAADWSTRPLPREWLTYAALDVELLVQLRDAVAALLAEQGKLGWAAQEFAAVRDADPPPRVDPWRRTSGLHQLKNRRQLAALRELWLTRDDIARRRDIAPGRILPDKAMTAAASAMPRTEKDLAKLPVFSGPANRRIGARWMAAIDRARALSDTDLPPASLPTSAPPPQRSWAGKHPDAAARLTAARQQVSRLAEEHHIPAENLITPDYVRRLCWQPPVPATERRVRDTLAEMGARRWQVDLVAGPFTMALNGASDPVRTDSTDE
ncbi:MAG: ribonuclease D [Micrococcales bacterium]|nr:MAG: ribonuclease D [Micrococcales bacterium]PIE26959.1 MAG: ribonuclease D [Micrococcales bacterium]